MNKQTISNHELLSRFANLGICDGTCRNSSNSAWCIECIAQEILEQVEEILNDSAKALREEVPNIENLLIQCEILAAEQHTKKENNNVAD